MHTRIGPCLLALAGCVSYGKTEGDNDDPPSWSWMFGNGSDTGFDDDDDEWYYYDDTGGGGGGDWSDVDFSVNWGSDAVTLDIFGGSGDYWFGMAETGCPDASNCWYGEDCLYGDLTGTYFYCHPADSPGVTLEYTSDLDLNESYETLLHDGVAAAVTYYVESSNSGNCWIWGDDTSYYSGLGCEVL